ncbi:hypothetical protein [Actinomadura hibisca]|uniref:hypothetical protein n=1 Tax=Actinomadura hibisca TaxID=68565 RepID=UPI000B0CAA38|nr:hypothetical protein [Actinomadura hibisca]
MAARPDVNRDSAAGRVRARRRLALVAVAALGITVAATVPPPESPLTRLAQPGVTQTP